MRTVYLIRHGEPEFPDGKKFCLSRTDLPLSTLGKLQGAILGASLPRFPSGNLFSSPLLRARETASFLGRPTVEPGLTELGMGCWEGLTFAEIRKKYPDIYAARGINPYTALIPGGEPPEECKLRMLHCVDKLLEKTTGDIAVVSHAGAIRLFLASLNFCHCPDFLKLPQPYGGVTKLILDRGVITPEYTGSVLKVPLTRELCIRLLTAAGAPDRMVRHSLAVEKQALRLAEGYAVDRELLSRAALLHDIARTYPAHAETGADWLESLGYAEEAALVRAHTDLPEEAQNKICEASLLFLADKTVLGDMPVSIEERFAASAHKCRCDVAVAAAQRRLNAAKKIQMLMET